MNTRPSFDTAADAPRVLAGPCSTALVWDATTEAGRKGAAAFFGGLGLSPAETARHNSIQADEHAMVREAMEARRTGGDSAGHAVAIAHALRSMGV